jgi:PST family polysaccharide transporter
MSGHSTSLHHPSRSNAAERPAMNARALPSQHTDLLFVYLAYALRYLYLLILTPFYGRVLGVEGYAQVLAAMSLMNMVWLFVSWGFVPAGGREIATAPRSGYGGIFWQHVSARALLSTLALGGGIVATLASPILASHPVIGVCAVLLGIVSAYNLGWYFTASERPRHTVKLEVLGFVLSLIPILSLVRAPGDAWVVLACLLVSGVMALALAHWWVRHEISPARFSPAAGLALVRSSSTLFVYTCSSTLLVASSTYLLSLLSSGSEVGSFGAAERLVSVGLSVMGPASQIFVPRITALFLHDEGAAFRMVRKAALLLGGIGLSGLVASLLLGHWVVRLIFGAGFEASVPVLHLLAIVFPLAAINQIIGAYVLVPQHREGLLTRVTLIGAGLSLLCAIPAGLAWGALGMAAARVGGELAVAAMLLLTSWRMGILQRLLDPESEKTP